MEVLLGLFSGRAHRITRGMSEVTKEERVFFFEKKNQKTFVCSGTRGSNHVGSPVNADRHKFFGSFFQKRTASFL